MPALSDSVRLPFPGRRRTAHGFRALLSRLGVDTFTFGMFAAAMVSSGLAGHAQAQPQDCTVDGKSVSPSNGNTTAGVTGIMRCVDRDTQLIRREQELQAGKFQGLERFYEKGKLAREWTTNERGNREGLARAWAPNGQLVSEEFYKAGSNLGLQKFFRDTGTLKSLSFYELSPQNKPDSPFIQTVQVADIDFNENGKIADIKCNSKPVIKYEQIDDRKLCGFDGTSTIELFSGDRLAGRRIYTAGKASLREGYGRDGKLRFQVQVADNKTIDRRFNDAGTKLKEIVFVELDGRGVRENEKDFHESGTLVAEKRWTQGKLSAELSWYLNGQPKRQVDYREQEFTERSFHDNGKLSSEGSFATERNRSRRIGIHRVFDEQARPRIETSYDDRGRTTREREFDDTGKVVRDDAVFEDGSRKAFSK